MKRILVGTEGSERATTAVEWATELCRAGGGELVVATVWSAADDPGPLEHEVERREERKRALTTTWAAPARARGVTTETRLLEGDAATELVRAADEEDPDLVVVGAAGDTTTRPLAHHLVHHLNRPLATVPPSSAAVAGGTIVVGIDGSRASDAALGFALDLAGDCDASVVAVFAHDELADSFPHPDLANWHYRGEEAVLTQLDRFGRAGVDVQLARPGGSAVHALQRVADELVAGAIVVGTRGRGGLHGLVVGRVPLSLIDHATRPVVVVPH